MTDPVVTDNPDTAVADKQALAEQADAALSDAPAEDVLRWAAETFGRRLAVTASMQDGVLPYLTAQAAPEADVLFLETGYHFAETIGTRDAVAAVYDVRVVDVLPEQTVAEQDAEHGAKLHDRNPDLCCALRKTAPLDDALGRYDAWVTGVRRVDASTRANTKVVDYDAKRDMIKISPLAAWTDEQLDTYIDEHQILVNPLLRNGYPSIGCAPCTRAVAPGEDPRAGRWSNSSKTECGIHT